MHELIVSQYKKVRKCLVTIRSSICHFNVLGFTTNGMEWLNVLKNTCLEDGTTKKCDWEGDISVFILG